MRHTSPKERNIAREIKLPESRKFPQNPIPLPEEIFLPANGEEAFELIRSVSFCGKYRNNCIWAQKRGELIYSSSGVLIQEQITSSHFQKSLEWYFNFHIGCIKNS